MMISDGAIGLLIGFMLGSLSGVFCFALVYGAGGDYPEDEPDDWDDGEDK